MHRLKGLAKSTIVPSSAKAADPFAAALRVGQAAVQAEAAAKKNEDGEGGSKQRLKELSAFVESRLQERGATLVSLWREASQSSEPRVREEFEYSLSSSFKGASVEVLERLQDFADMSAEELRKAVKQATIDSQMKLEQTRIASNLNVRNARVELETAFNTKLQEKISELQSNDGQEKLLQEAMEREAVLKSMFELQKERAVKAEQREKVLKDDLARAASAAAAAEKASAALAAQRELEALEAMATAANLRAETDAVHAQLEEVLARLGTQEAEAIALAERATAAEEATRRLRSEVIADVDAAAQRVAKELRSEVRRLARRLRSSQEVEGIVEPPEPPEDASLDAPLVVETVREDPEAAARREAAAARLRELEALVEEQRAALEQGAAGQRALELHLSELEARLRQVSDDFEAA